MRGTLLAVLLLIPLRLSSQPDTSGDPGRPAAQALPAHDKESGMRFHPLRATVLAWLALLLAVFSLRAPSAQAAASKTSNDDLARYADQLFSQTYPANEPGAALWTGVEVGGRRRTWVRQTPSYRGVVCSSRSIGKE